MTAARRSLNSKRTLFVIENNHVDATEEVLSNASVRIPFLYDSRSPSMLSAVVERSLGRARHEDCSQV